MRLIEAYAGNPLALKIVAQTIVELFEGEIALFLEQGEVVFGGVRELLDQQYARLSALEQSVLLWLAILREPVNLQELLAVLGTPLSRATVLEAVEALRRRSLIERGQRQGSFTLHSVVLEFTTARLIAETGSEIQQSHLSRLIEHGLTLAGSQEYVRQIQVRLIVVPLLLQLRSAYPERTDLEDHLLALLKRLRARADYAKATDRPMCWRCCMSNAGICVVSTCRILCCVVRICKKSRCRIQRCLEQCCRIASGRRPSVPSGPWRSVTMDSTGQRAAGGGKCGCGFSRRCT